MKRCLAVKALVFLFVLNPGPSAAGMEGGGAGEEEAQRLFETGQRKYSADSYDEALEAFTLAFVAWPHPAFLFNIAQCHRQLDNHAAAVFFFETYLGKMPDAKNRETVQDLIDWSRATLRETGEEDTFEPSPEIARLIRKGEQETDDAAKVVEEPSTATDEEAVAAVSPEALDEPEPTLDAVDPTPEALGELEPTFDAVDPAP